jgi:hypothetical protein
VASGTRTPLNLCSQGSVRSSGYEAPRREPVPMRACVITPSPDLRAAFAADRANKLALDVAQPHMIGPSISGILMGGCTCCWAIDLDAVDALLAKLAERDRGGHGSVSSPLNPSQERVRKCPKGLDIFLD